MVHLSSRRHPEVQQVRDLVRRASTRRTQGVLIVEGPKVLHEALAAGFAPQLVLLDADAPESDELAEICTRAGAAVHWVSSDTLSSVADTRTPHAAVAVVGYPDAGGRQPELPTVVTVGVADPGNLGTLLRSAEAAGARSVVVTEGCDLRAPKVVRAAAGAHFHLQVGECSHDELRHLLGEWSSVGVESYALTVDGEVSLWDIAPGAGGAERQSGRVVLVGSESHGLPATIAAACSHRVRIPHRGRAESLNVGVAFGVAAFWLLNGPVA